MSTTFGILIKDGKLLDLTQSEDINIEINEEETDVIEVAYRGNGTGFRWKNCLALFLPSKTKVYPLDNTAQGVFTIGDILKEINNNGN
jgi:hypothetical protein